jgi:superfamily I DNA and/or RNA helicase
MHNVLLQFPERAKKPTKSTMLKSSLFLRSRTHKAFEIIGKFHRNKAKRRKEISIASKEQNKNFKTAKKIFQNLISRNFQTAQSRICY